MNSTDTDFGGEVVSFDLPNNISAAFDTHAFDEAILAHGVKFIHWRGMRNPVGLLNRYDSRRPGDDNEATSNGLIYTKAGCVHCLVTGNSKDVRAIEAGYLSSATAQITAHRTYASGEEVFLAPMDRLYLAEESVLVTHQQLVNRSETGSDALQYPAIKVLDLIDSTGMRHRQGESFNLSDGHIVWISGASDVYAVRYLYRPYWIVERLMHEVRVAQVDDPINGRITVRMPQSAIVQREYVFRNEKSNADAPQLVSGHNRQAEPPPTKDEFGPR